MNNKYLLVLLSGLFFGGCLDQTMVEINLTTSNHKSFINKFAHGVMFKNTLKGLKQHLEK